jgi:Xaa-Pro aminopeptidase
MRSAFKKADEVVYQTQIFVEQCYEKNQSLRESEIDDYVKKQFFKSGARELSFRPICAGGKNGAIIHYASPNSEQKIEASSLFLLDTGAYYEGGYATDLTRTFLVGNKNIKPEKWQKEMFTLVLKASIRGLSARFRRGLLGSQLDAMVRAPLWQAGFDYAHGTGHGVGINVHEFPPRIGPTSSSIILENQVFSIEPGLYFKNLGGVRIENLVTVVSDPTSEQFLRILPLTFCPFDERLIEFHMLDSYEQEFLSYFNEQFKSPSSWPALPPLPKFSF